MPTAPLNLAFTPTAGRSDLGTLTWNAPSFLGNPELVDYEIQYSLDGSTWIVVPDQVSTLTSVPVSNLKAATHYYVRVRANNGGNDLAGSRGSDWSSVLEFDTPAALVPTAPTGFTASSVTANTAAIAWTAPSYNGGANITDFVVETLRDGSSDWVAVPKSVSTSVNLSLTGLAPGTHYQVRIAAVNSSGNSDYLYGDITTAAGPASKPQSLVLSNLTANTLTLSWSLPATNGGNAIIDYKIEFSSNGGTTWNAISHTASNNLAFDVSGLNRAQTYLFRVSAITGYGVGDASDALTVTTLALAPAAPTTLTTTSITNSTATIGWTAPTDNGGSAITDYKVELSRDGVTWTEMPHSVALTRSYAVTGLAPGTTYQVRVSAINAIGTSPALVGTLTTGAVAPASVTNLSASNITSNALALSWNIPASNGGSAITDYSVQVSSNGISFTTINHVASNSNLFNVSALAAGTKYWFKVAAVNAKGVGTYTDAIWLVTPGNAPSAVTTLSVSKITATGFTLGWSKALVAGGSAVRNYIVEYSTDGGITWVTLSKAVSTSTSMTITGMRSKTTYKLRVTAVNDVGASAASKVLTVITK